MGSGVPGHSEAPYPFKDSFADPQELGGMGGPGVAAYPWNDELAVYLPQSEENQQAPLWKK